MSATHLGFYNTSSSRTHVRFQFSTHASAGGNVAPLSAFEAADLRIYKASDGAAFSATQRSSANGITMTSPFDSLTGFHDVDIDLTDNTDSGFYAAGCLYTVVLAPDSETIDGQTITGLVLAYFEIGVPAVNVTQFGGTAGTFSGGRPEVNASHAGGTAWATAINTALDLHEGPDLPTGSVATDAGNSATSFKTDRTEATNDFWKDALLLITSGSLAGQVKKVSGYNGTTKVITVTGGFTGTPADGVTFALVNR